MIKLVSFKNIDDASMYPNISLHVDHPVVFRAVKNANSLTVDDFLPSNINNMHQLKTFKRQVNPGDYSLSVFTDLDSLKRILSYCPALLEKTKALAKGFTTISRGISYQENSEHHVDYFLYDYENNSPKDDFAIVEVINYEE